MSISAQLEELQKKKAELQNELGSFDEKEKSMGTNVKMHAPNSSSSLHVCTT